MVGFWMLWFLSMAVLFIWGTPRMIRRMIWDTVKTRGKG